MLCYFSSNVQASHFSDLLSFIGKNFQILTNQTCQCRFCFSLYCLSTQTHKPLNQSVYCRLPSLHTYCRVIICYSDLTWCFAGSHQSPIMPDKCLPFQQRMSRRGLSLFSGTLLGAPLLPSPYFTHHSLGSVEQQVLCLFWGKEKTVECTCLTISPFKRT